MKDKIKVGSKVRYLGCNGMRQTESFSPPIGTIGEVLEINNKCEDAFIKWPAGTTVGNGEWWCELQYLELVAEDTSAVSKDCKYLGYDADGDYCKIGKGCGVNSRCIKLRGQFCTWHESEDDVEEEMPKFIGQQFKIKNPEYTFNEDSLFANAVHNVGIMIGQAFDKECYNTIYDWAKEKGYTDILVLDEATIKRALEREMAILNSKEEELEDLDIPSRYVKIKDAYDTLIKDYQNKIKQLQELKERLDLTEKECEEHDKMGHALDDELRTWQHCYEEKCAEYNRLEQSLIEERENWEKEFDALQERALSAEEELAKLKKRRFVLCVEDGSMDLEVLDLLDDLDGKILCYRQGSQPPYILDLSKTEEK